MKSNKFLMQVILMSLLVAALAACSASISEETELLVEANQKYAVRYPSNFDLEFYGEDGVAILKGTRNEYKGARADINLLHSGHATTQQLAAEYVADYPRVELTRSTITLDGEEAVVIDGVPGKLINRIVLIVHNDILYKFNFVPGDPSDRDYDEMEALYKVIIESFEFDPQP